MKLIKNLIMTLLLLLPLSGMAQETVKWSSEVADKGNGRMTITLKADIEKGYHIYDMGPYDFLTATKFSFEPNSDIALDGQTRMVNKVKRHMDPTYGIEIGHLEGTALFEQDILLKNKATKTVQKVVISYQACNDQNCLTPTDVTLSIPVEGNVAAKAAAAKTEAKAAATKTEAKAAATEAETEAKDKATAATAKAETTAQAAEPTIAADSVAKAEFKPVVSDTEGNGSLWAMILEAILWGFAALLTPCVFPMVPMTVSFFMKSSTTPARGRVNATLYGTFIVLLYTLPIAAIILITRIFGGDSVTADIFNWLSTHWLPNLLFFAVFMIFAASFFGAFEITLPSKLVNKSDEQSDRGGIGGIFFMALTLVLVSFSCTGPIVGSVLIKSTSGEFWSPIITMLCFSLAFALPFTIFAFFPSMLRKLPKSGGWLNSVKVVLGFVEVALGLKFLSTADQVYHWGLLDREVYLAIWIVVFTLLGFYLLGKLRFAHDSETTHIGVGRLFMAIGVFSFVVYLVPGMWGAPLKGLSGYLPPMETQDFVLGRKHLKNHLEGVERKYTDFLHLPHGLNGFFDLKEAQAYAKKVNKPLFIDFTGHGCVNCREMEQKVWSDDKVLDMLNDQFIIVALYVDDKTELPESEWVKDDNGNTLKSLGKINAYYALKYYGVNAQPSYVIEDTDGVKLAEKHGRDTDIAAFRRFLQSGLDAHHSRK